jgi:hypothetical protein
MSGLIGPQNQQYVPLSAMNGAGDMALRLIINDATAAVKATDAGFSSFSITNMRFVVQIVQLDDIAESKVHQAFSGGVLSLYTEGWTTYVNTLAAGGTSASIVIPAKNFSYTLFPLSPHL